MTRTIVLLKHPDINNGYPVPIPCNEVKVTLNKTNDKKPNANYSDSTVARVQSVSLENPKYILSGVKFGVHDYGCDSMSGDCNPREYWL